MPVCGLPNSQSREAALRVGGERESSRTRRLERNRTAARRLRCDAASHKQAGAVGAGCRCHNAAGCRRGRSAPPVGSSRQGRCERTKLRSYGLRACSTMSFIDVMPERCRHVSRAHVASDAEVDVVHGLDRPDQRVAALPWKLATVIAGSVAAHAAGGAFWCHRKCFYVVAGRHRIQAGAIRGLSASQKAADPDALHARRTDQGGRLAAGVTSGRRRPSTTHLSNPS